jgi:peroxiredoxin
MSLKGETKCLKDGEMLYLIAGGQTPCDSTVIKNGKFEFSLKNVEPQEALIVRKGEKGAEYIMFYLDYYSTYIKILPGIDFVFNTQFMNCEVTGNPTDAVVRDVNNMFLHAKENMYDNKDFIAKLKAAILRHDMSSAYVANKYNQAAYMAGLGPDISDCLHAMSAQVKNSIAGKEMQQVYDKNSNTSDGSTVSDFTMKDDKGQTVSLLQYAKGKNLVLIDFWASWCAPCRKEGKNIKAIYADYHKKGFDVLGVSLDEDAAKWKTAIAEEGYSWKQVTDLKGFSSPVSKQFDFSSIPTLYLIDGDGIIIAKNLRGEALRQKVAEYCQ